MNSTDEGEKILIVDDDPGLRRLLERFLSEQGYRVRSASNVEQMDRLLSRELFGLLVLDLMLPGEDGLSACQRLREGGNEIPIIMLTAKGDELNRIQGLQTLQPARTARTHQSRAAPPTPIGAGRACK